MKTIHFKTHNHSQLQRGSVLIATVIILAIVILLMSVLLNQGRVTALYSNTAIHSKELHYASDSGLEQARYYIAKSEYNAQGNAWLRDPTNVMNGGVVTPDPPIKMLIAAIQNGNPVPTAGGELSSGQETLKYKLGRCVVRIYIYNTGGRIFRIYSIAHHPIHNRVTARAINVVERDTFARYIFFVDESINFGNTTTTGDVHANNFISFSQEGAVGLGFQSYGEFTTVNGLYISDRGSLTELEGDPASQNIHFYGPTNGHDEKRPRPQSSDLKSLKNSGLIPSTGSGSVYLMEKSPAANNFWRQNHGLVKIDSVSKLHFDGNDVILQVKGKNADGESVTSPSVKVPLPSEGLIYTEAPVTSMQGELGGRVSVAVDSKGQGDSYTKDSIIVTGPILYTDSEGQHPYELFEVNSDGTKKLDDNGFPKIISDLQSTGYEVPWDKEHGLSYEKNPAYLAESSSPPPVLGLMAEGRVRLSENAPYNMVMHSAHISVDHAWTTTFDPRFHGKDYTLSNLQDLKRGNFRQLGARVEKGGYAGRYLNYSYYEYNHVTESWDRKSDKSGYYVSGEYIYDDRLRNSPPPHFLEEERPIFGERYNVTTKKTQSVN